MKLKVTIWTFYFVVIIFFAHSMVYAVDYDQYISVLADKYSQKQEKTRRIFFDGLERIYAPLSYGHSFEEHLLFADLDGDNKEECIVAFTGPSPSGSEVFIFKKNGKYDLVSHFHGGRIEKIQTANLVKPTISELVIDSTAVGTWRYLYRSIYKWNGEKISLIWGGKVEDIYAGSPGNNDKSYDIRANIRYLDIDNDGIKEILREKTEKRFRHNEQSKKMDKPVSTKKISQVYKWSAKEFKYNLLSEK